MMHHEDVVVTIVDDKKKPLREHDFAKTGERTRKCKVVLPFDTEYKVLVKNQNNRRLKLEIEIDGTVVSGSGIIIDKNATDYIERFISVDKKFKFVKPNSDGVSDPTNVENGLVKVRVTKEKDAPIPQTPIIVKEHHYHHYDYWYPYNRRYLIDPWVTYGGGTTGDGLVGGCFPDSSGDITYGGSFGGPLHTLKGTSLGDSLKMNQSSYSGEPLTQWNASEPCNLVGSMQNADGSLKSLSNASIGEVGATVEGGKSDQVFTGTFWNGDLGDASIFTFQLLGMKEPDQKEYEEYLKLKQKFEG